uniref:Uncharacterized protein n=1 Tax=Anguilla anguilla TaxID=7936 RepID=A0A0E9RSF9_ANGAN
MDVYSIEITAWKSIMSTNRSRHFVIIIMQ